MILEFPKFPYFNCDPSKIDSMINKIINLDRYDYPEIDSQGTKIWRNSEGQRHRLDGPAVIYANGSEFYYQNGKRHRLDGPAAIWEDGDVEYWEKGVRIK